jgi:hypothetical protein
MKTLAISTLALFAIACAPEASLTQDAPAEHPMEEINLDDELARTGLEETRLVEARKELREIKEDMVESGADVVGMLRGNFDDETNTFTAIAYDSAGRAFFRINGKYTWTDAPKQERILTGTAIATLTEKSGKTTRIKGSFEGATVADSYYGQQIFDGMAPLLHEGIWIAGPDRTSGRLIGLVAIID